MYDACPASYQAVCGKKHDGQRHGQRHGQDRSRPWYTVLYIQVLIAIAIGVAVGHFCPDTGMALKPLGDGFIALIKMMIAPVIFCTVVHGIGSMSDLKKVGRVGVKTLFYFEVVSTLALAIGLIVGESCSPARASTSIRRRSIRRRSRATSRRAKEEGIVAHLMGIIPDSFFGALARGDLLQVLLVSILTGFAIARLGKLGEKITAVIDGAAKVFFGIIRIIVRAAPIGAFGAMAFTIGAYGLGSLVNLRADRDVLPDQHPVRAGRARHDRASRRLLDPALHRLHQGRAADRARHLSSETVLPHMIQKMEHLGASKSVVGLVIPTGYSFNLDGTNIYMTLATLFLAQATNTPLTLQPGARHPGDRHDHLEGRVRRHRRGLRHARRDARDRSGHPDPVARASCSASTSS